MKSFASKIVVFLFVFMGCGFTEPQPCSILDRVVVTGASVTAGYGVTTPPIAGDLGAYQVTMQHIMEGMITSEHEEVMIFGDLMFFQHSKENATAYIEQIKEYKPSLVIGVDFLFWFGHGTPPTDCDVPTYRMEKLNFALNLLEKLNVPVVIGNLPDVRNAIGKMLSNNQVPSKELLVQMNKRIHSWGTEHENVSIIDVFTLWNKLLHDEEIVLVEHTWPAGSREKLLQKDMLHTTFEGTVAASLLVAEATIIDCIETDPKVIMKKAAANARASSN